MIKLAKNPSIVGVYSFIPKYHAGILLFLPKRGIICHELKGQKSEKDKSIML